MLTAVEELKPTLSEPFPNTPRYWKDPKTGLVVPKMEIENLEWRGNLLKNTEKDLYLQRDLLAACRESQLFWINTFVWTYHQFDVDPNTGLRMEAKQPHNPFITWEIQDNLFNEFELCLKKAEDILIDKCRDMGASWACILFNHWLWLFRPESQILEMSRVKEYVDQTGNMKALFQKHDYVNSWLPEWMRPPGILRGEKNRSMMHMMNIINGSCIDGESTTEHAASGDRRLVILLDEFSKVDHGQLMRSATRDAGHIRVVNSTPAGPGTEYARWKASRQIKVFILPFWDHPEKGKGRYIKQKEDGSWEIRSPWLDHEATVRSPQEMAREILRQDLESGELFFNLANIEKHQVLFGKKCRTRYHIHFKKGTANDQVHDLIRRRHVESIMAKQGSKGPLRVWTQLIMDRPDQTKTYIFGIDISKGQGASNSVISIKCKETGEKIAEWCDANTPPYDMARIAIALAIWCGGRKPRKLPFFKWENNGPGWDFGRIVVKDFNYPYYYRNEKPGQIIDKKSMQYGFQTNTQSKFELLSLYDRILAHGGYINHSIEALDEAKQYIHYTEGIGPACLVEESQSAKKTHGDRVIADALTLDDKELPRVKHTGPTAPENSWGGRYKKAMAARKKSKGWRKKFDFGHGN